MRNFEGPLHGCSATPSDEEEAVLILSVSVVILLLGLSLREICWGHHFQT